MHSAVAQTLRFSAFLFAVIAVAACQSGSPERAELDPDIDLPQHYTAGPQVADSLARFSDPQLLQLVDEAWQNNPDLRLMAAQLASARAEARRAGAALRPQLTVGAEASRQDTPITENFRLQESRYALNTQLSWEIDLWGRVRASRDAAAAAYRASEADYAGARLATAANAILLWLDLAESEAQRQLARHTAANLERSEAIVESRFEAGLVNVLDLRMARSSTAMARNVEAQRNRQRDGLIRALETLLGRYPAAHLDIPEDLPGDYPEIQPGLPSELLERRPDIRAAAARYDAATRGLDAAERARLPSLSLTASAGQSSSELGQLLESDASIWNLAANLTAPIFDGGRLAAEADLSRAEVEQAAVRYAEVVLQAFREVETALNAETFLHDQEKLLATATAEANEAEQLANERYERGLVPFATVLEAQRSAFDNRSQLLAIRAERLKNHIELILALGGDFQPAL